MASTGPIVGSFQIAQAYGVRAPAVRAMGGAKKTASSDAPVQALEAKPASRLVAAVVPGRVNFAGAAPAPQPGAIAMYRHPADKNAAATGVSAGRMIDVEG